MAEVTDGDRERAGQVAERTAYRGRKVLEKAIAAALAEEREKAREGRPVTETFDPDPARWQQHRGGPPRTRSPFLEEVGRCGSPSPGFIFGGTELSKQLCDLPHGHGGMHEHLNLGDMQPMRWTHGGTPRAAEETE